MDVFNAFKGIADMIRDAVEGAMPRQAVVTRSEESGVWVRYTPVNADSPEMWFPSSIAGLPAGTSGWVHPLAGGKGRFIATAVPMAIPFHGIQAPGASASTTATAGDMTYPASASITLDPGQWEIAVFGEGTIWRSVDTGARVHSVRIDGAFTGPYHDLDMPTLRTHPAPRRLSRITTVTVTERRDVTVDYGFRGGTSAGTTYCTNAVVYGTARMIGGLS